MIEFAIKSQLLSYDEAWLYCVTCTHNNKYDWRFPTIADVADYESIIDTNHLKQPYYSFYVTPVRTI